MLTARGEDMDRIIGLRMGADDYLAKPFVPRDSSPASARCCAAPRAAANLDAARPPTRACCASRTGAWTRPATWSTPRARWSRSPAPVPHARGLPVTRRRCCRAFSAHGTHPGTRGRRVRSLDRPAGEPAAPAPRRQRARTGDHQDRAQRRGYVLAAEVVAGPPDTDGAAHDEPAALPRSLFARLMLIWLVGTALVLAVSLALFLGERGASDAVRCSRAWHGDRQRSPSCSTACRRPSAGAGSTDRPPPPASRCPTTTCVRSPTTARCRPRCARPCRNARPLYPSGRRPPPLAWRSCSLSPTAPAAGPPAGHPPLLPIMPHQRALFLAALPAGAGAGLAHLDRGAHRHPELLSHGGGGAALGEDPTRAP